MESKAVLTRSGFNGEISSDLQNIKNGIINVN